MKIIKFIFILFLPLNAMAFDPYANPLDDIFFDKYFTPSPKVKSEKKPPVSNNARIPKSDDKAATLKRNYNPKNTHLPKQYDNNDYASFLFSAAIRGDINAITAIHNQGHNIQVVNRDGDSLLVVAVKEQQYPVVKLLLEYGYPANEANPLGYTALHYAAALLDADICLELIKHGNNVNIVDKSGSTPLIWAAKNNRAEIAKLLLDNGADPRIRMQSGRTALHFAAKNGGSEIISLLAGKDRIDFADYSSYTPLMIAAFNGNSIAVQMLLNMGANKFFKDKYGRNAYELAVEAGHKNLADYIKNYGR
jgi:ankyrin repeat protein